jgi:hypothetical protein
LVQYRVYSASGDSFAVWTQRGEHLLLSWVPSIQGLLSQRRFICSLDAEGWTSPALTAARGLGHMWVLWDRGGAHGSTCCSRTGPHVSALGRGWGPWQHLLLIEKSKNDTCIHVRVSKSL